MRAAIVIIMLLVPVLARATTAVSLTEALALALEGNHQLRAARHVRAAMAREVARQRGRYLPQVTVEEAFAVTDSAPAVFTMKLDQGRFSRDDFDPATLNRPSAYHTFLTAISVQQLLFDLPVARAIEAAEHGDRGKGHRLAWQRQGTALKVYEAYLGVRKSRALLTVAEQGVASAREHLRLAQVRHQSGTGLKSDELRARSHLAEMEQQLITVGNDLLLARVRLGQVVGQKPGIALDITDDPAPHLVVPPDEELARLALENRQDLKELQAEVARAEAGVAAARGAYLPAAYAGASYRLNDRDHPFGRDGDGWQVGVSLRWDLFDGLKREHTVGQAREMKMAAAASEEHFRDEVLVQVMEQSLRRREAAQRLVVSETALLQAEEGVRLVSRRFENSLATMVELLDAETARNRSRYMVVENENGVVLATARVLAAAGLLLKEVGR